MDYVILALLDLSRWPKLCYQIMDTLKVAYVVLLTPTNLF